MSDNKQSDNMHFAFDNDGKIHMFETDQEAKAFEKKQETFTQSNDTHHTDMNFYDFTDVLNAAFLQKNDSLVDKCLNDFLNKYPNLLTNEDTLNEFLGLEDISCMLCQPLPEITAKYEQPYLFNKLLAKGMNVEMIHPDVALDLLYYSSARYNTQWCRLTDDLPDRTERYEDAYTCGAIADSINIKGKFDLSDCLLDNDWVRIGCMDGGKHAVLTASLIKDPKNFNQFIKYTQNDKGANKQVFIADVGMAVCQQNEPEVLEKLIENGLFDVNLFNYPEEENQGRPIQYALGLKHDNTAILDTLLAHGAEVKFSDLEELSKYDPKKAEKFEKLMDKLPSNNKDNKLDHKTDSQKETKKSPVEKIAKYGKQLTGHVIRCGCKAAGKVVELADNMAQQLIDKSR